MAKRGPGRPKKIISLSDMAKAEELAYINAKNFTIESLMGWSKEFIAQRPDITARLARKRQEGSVAVLRKQAEKCEKGDTTMLIWVGKNRLEQSDRIAADITAKILKIEGLEPIGD